MRVRISLHELTEQEVLSGSLEGQRLFGKLVGLTRPAPEVQLCFLDFRQVAVATSSYLRDSVMAYRDYARRQYPNLYPVAANLSAHVSEELQSFLASQRDAWVACELDEFDRSSVPAIIGSIEGKSAETLAEVLKRGETDAPTIAAAIDPKGTASPTVWNNRLAALCTKGILIELGRGRPRRYKPVIEGLQHGS